MERFDRVFSDHETGGYMLTRWLLERGRTKVRRLWAGDVEAYWVRARNRGYERAMREAGLAPLPARVMKSTTARPANPNRDRHEQRTREMAGYLVDLARGGEVDALMLFTDYDAFAAADACRLCGLDVGRDVLIAGCDNV